MFRLPSDHGSSSMAHVPNNPVLEAEQRALDWPGLGSWFSRSQEGHPEARLDTTSLGEGLL